jgi:hypothetical protein
MAFLIEFHDQYSIKALNTDFRNETQVDWLQNNPLYLDFSIGRKVKLA